MRTFPRIAASTLGVAALALAVLVPAAGAGTKGGGAPLTVVKTVSGPVPAGTTFTATIQCDESIIYTGDEPIDQATVTFDATGQPTSADTVTFVDPGQCIVTETADGGAATTTYSCEAIEPEVTPVEDGGVGGSAIVEPSGPICSAAGPQADPIAVNIEYKDQEATVTIHNTFVAPEPQAAPAVAAQPAFTG
jgi:hypothetical protein